MDFWSLVSYFGDITCWVSFTIAFTIIYYFQEKKERRKIRWVFYQLILSGYVTYAFVLLLKFIFRIPRPCIDLPYCPSGYSFPSGHTAISFAWLTALLMRTERKKYLFLLPIPFLVAISRIMLGVHTWVDVAGGAVVGITTSILVRKIERIWRIF